VNERKAGSAMDLPFFMLPLPIGVYLFGQNLSISAIDVLFLHLPKGFDLIHKSTILPCILSPWELSTFMSSSIQFVERVEIFAGF
jgi:hypothetical protein